jgi:hypothetical protein
VEGPIEYRCEATSIAGFVQQLAVAYVARGYFFYVTGTIPDKKDPREVDERLISKYGIAVGKTARARRKALGLANLQYLRYDRTFVIVATRGKHAFFEKEGTLVRDARETPIKFGGYAISYRNGHPHVRIEQGRYHGLQAYFADIAVHRTKEALERELRYLSFEPYAPVRGQIFGIVRAVNRKRRLAQYEEVLSSCIRVRRRIVKPFEPQELGEPDTTQAIIARPASAA